MKKIYSLVAAVMAFTSVMGQSQRLCLLEEFTQASCPPCAAQNPALNTLLSANTAKVASIKYQTNWPGVDPMNAQTQTWVGPRVTYYGTTGVPNIRFDGTVTNGLPNVLTQSIIDNRYAVTSPFTLNLTHNFSSDFDSIFISAELICTQAVSGTLKLHVALVEEEIAFCSPPGSNGEDVFYGVCREMWPSASGTTLATSWTNGTSQTFTFADAVPSYLYSAKQMAVVAFVQDDATKNVQQAAISNPQPLPNYAILKSCTPPSVPPLVCTNTITGLSTDLTNDGTSVLTSALISYSVDGGAPSTFTWNGSLAPGASAPLSLPTINFTGNGTHSVQIFVAEANGQPNPQCADARINLNFTANVTAVSTNVTELFTATAFPPAGWGRFDNAGDNVGWSRNAVGVSGNNGSAKIDYYNSTSGNVDDLYTPAIDLTAANNPVLTFKIAKAPYTGYTDRLDVVASTDCGATWGTPLFSKSDPALSTAAAATTAFTPTTTSTWRTETVSLSSLVGNPNVILAFRAISGYGNNGYIDEINVNFTTGVGENALEQQISLFPTPTAGTVFLNLSVIKDPTVRISVMDVAGKVLHTFVTDRSNQTEINLEGYQNGSYMIQVDADNQRIIKKVILNR